MQLHSLFVAKKNRVSYQAYCDAITRSRFFYEQLSKKHIGAISSKIALLEYRKQQEIIDWHEHRMGRKTKITESQYLIFLLGQKVFDARILALKIKNWWTNGNNGRI